MRDGKPLSLLVRNLRYTTSPDRVRKFFEQFGEVRDVYLPLDYYTKLPRGFGFVEFSRDEDAEAALQALSRYAMLDGAEVSVTVAQQGRKSPESMRHREKSTRSTGGGNGYRDHDSRGDDGRRPGRGRTRSRSYSGDRGGRYGGRYYNSGSRSRSIGYGHDRRRRYRDDGYSRRFDRSESREIRRRPRRGSYSDEERGRRYRRGDSGRNGRAAEEYPPAGSRSRSRRHAEEFEEGRKHSMSPHSDREMEGSGKRFERHDEDNVSIKNVHRKLSNGPIDDPVARKDDISPRESRSGSDSPDRRVHNDDVDDLRRSRSVTPNEV